MSELSVAESADLVQKILEAEDTQSNEDQELTQKEEQIKKQRFELNGRRDKHRAHANDVKESLTKQRDAVRMKRAEDAKLLSAATADDEYEELLTRLNTLAAKSKEIGGLIEKLDRGVGNTSTTSSVPALPRPTRGQDSESQTSSEDHYAQHITTQQNLKLKDTALAAEAQMKKTEADQERKKQHLENQTSFGTTLEQPGVGATKATSKSNAALAESATIPRYSVQNMHRRFPETNNLYSHIVTYDNKTYELNCPICYTNSMSGGKYFDGANSFVAHIRQAHAEENLRSEQEIFEAAVANECLREVSQADIHRILTDSQPENVRKPDRGLNQKYSYAATLEEQYQAHVDGVNPLLQDFDASNVADSGPKRSNNTSSAFAAFSNTSADSSSVAFSNETFQSGFAVSAHNDGWDVATTPTGRPRRNQTKRKADDGSLRGMAALNAMANAEKDMKDMAINSSSQGDDTGAARKRSKKNDNGEDDFIPS